MLDDEYLEIARSLERGAWVEFEGEDGQLAFAKLAWVSPLRGTYLFTNRQGQKALSMTAEELADRFRADRARLVEAEPLIDRAFSSVLTQLNEKFGEETAAAALSKPRRVRDASTRRSRQDDRSRVRTGAGRASTRGRWR